MTRRASSLLFLILVSTAAAVTAADIDRALSFGTRTDNKIFRSDVRPIWLPEGKGLWYRVQTASNAHEFVFIDAATGARKSGPDLKSLGLPPVEPVRSSQQTLVIGRSRNNGVATTVKFVNRQSAAVDLFWVDSSGQNKPFGSIAAGAERDQSTYEGHGWLIQSKSGEALAFVEATAMPMTLVIDGKGKAPTKSAASKVRGTPSPDGKWSAYIDQGKVMLLDVVTGRSSPMKTDMDGKVPFRGGIHWSPDSTAFVVTSCAEVPVRRITIVESTPAGQLQPKLKEINYAKPGDPLPQPVPVLFRLTAEGYEWKRLNNALFPTPFDPDGQTQVRWSPDSREFYFDYNQRGHQLYRILAADAKTAEVRVVSEESSKTFVDYSQKGWRQWIDKTGELLVLSERDGWAHLYRVDVASGTVKNPITKGAWPVREVIHVDEEKREIWFYASGQRTGEDPYHKHLCRVGFDGTGFKRLTEGDGQHRVEFSPDRSHFVDTWSRSDLPPVSELRRSADGSLVCVLEKADITALLAAGWTMPERFVAKGRDGATDIHGVIIRPSNFDPKKKYPVVEEIYAGPHSAFAPKEFGRLVRHHQMAELGFIVVQLDGMGTNHRGKKFHDVAWKNIKDAGFPDRIAWIRAAAKTRPWMDLNRVGIYGGSAGGQNAMRALLDYNEFYKVAVADCGCHDNRMDKIWWNEAWMGWPVDESYLKSSNMVDAPKLKGNLLLIVGEMDTNVDPASTAQVVGALQKAGKKFEYMPIIGAGHGAAETPFGQRLRMEFLTKHLQP